MGLFDRGAIIRAASSLTVIEKFCIEKLDPEYVERIFGGIRVKDMKMAQKTQALENINDLGDKFATAVKQYVADHNIRVDSWSGEKITQFEE